MRKFCLSLFAGLLACAASAHVQVDHPLTLKEVMDLARAHNPSLASQALQLQATQANEVTAGLHPNPLLSAADVSINFQGMAPVDATVNVSQLFERGGKRRYRVESARLASSVARYGYGDFQRQLMLAVKQSFVALLLDQANLQVAEANR